MNHRLLGKIALIAFLIFLVGVIGMLKIGFTSFNTFNYKHSKVMESSRTIDLKGAESVEVEMELGIGEVSVNGGAADLMAADFVYDERTGEPDINYRLHGKRGILDISQKERHRWFNFSLFGTDYENNWNVMFNNNVPMDLEIKTGVGKQTLI